MRAALDSTAAMMALCLGRVAGLGAVDRVIFMTE